MRTNRCAKARMGCSLVAVIFAGLTVSTAQTGLLIPPAGPGAGQTATPSPTIRQPNGSVSTVPQGDDPLFSMGDSLRAKRNEERQRRLENDTQRLVALVSQLRGEIAATGAESMTPDMLRQMDEIEKLAKSVKDRMRN